MRVPKKEVSPNVTEFFYSFPGLKQTVLWEDLTESEEKTVGDKFYQQPVELKKEPRADQRVQSTIKPLCPEFKPGSQ